MDERKICFIACVNDEDEYREALFYINRLNIPYGFSFECVAVRGAKSMTSGYNAAMRKSDAKYKVYMHQDVHIVNRDFIENVVDIFKEDENIGALGMIGVTDIPRHGIWWVKDTGSGGHAELKEILALQQEKEWINPNAYGAVYQTGDGRVFSSGLGKVSDKKYMDAKLLDGLLIATQHDLFWREDLFDNWHFYDLSESCEFLKRNYRVVLPTQVDTFGNIAPWCIHNGINGGVNNAWEIGRRKFLTYYADLINV